MKKQIKILSIAISLLTCSSMVSDAQCGRWRCRPHYAHCGRGYWRMAPPRVAVGVWIPGYWAIRPHGRVWICGHYGGGFRKW
jgi:hypothetical protein